MRAEMTYEIEQRFAELSPNAQFTVLERLIHRMREQQLKEDAAFAAEMSAMASDPDIQREIREIKEEFRCTDGDGLQGY
jgi:hypothetical protein